MRRQTQAPERIRKKRAHFEAKRTPAIKSWSYSAYESYAACALQFKFKFVQKIKTPRPPSAERGIRVHKGAEDYLNNRALGLPIELQNWARRFAKIKQAEADVERPWAFDTTWTVAEYYSDDAWLRMKLDARVDYQDSITVIDLKTGGIYDKHIEQGELYALGAMYRFPEIEDIDVEFWYIDHDKVERHEYASSERDVLTKKWDKRAKKMANDAHFLPQPGHHCRWCSFSLKAGGPCKHGARFA